ncbi:flagellar protein FlaG [Shewanella glacialipiscicola]|uniref:flagellar protein FlaG n=1 Tax=Shewanella glacialipiscicola TaxID=614069 RepID=UPI0021DB21E9|nr:flagellar protein FlaG [Shewanella glacialipiscicola]MCU7995659.1 flagellar protein FlaG [Shewanella glacialipiscicola]MCU8026906.1 flagellar protein FlaG [Shewanella glacialipiscicola]
MDMNNLAVTVFSDVMIKPENRSTMLHKQTQTDVGVPAVDSGNKPTSNRDVNSSDKAATVADVSPEELQQAIDDISANMEMMQKGLAFNIDEESGVQVVKVVDIKTGDLIRQIPNQEALDIARKLSEITGVLMKTEV